MNIHKKKDVSFFHDPEKNFKQVDGKNVVVWTSFQDARNAKTFTNGTWRRDCKFQIEFYVRAKTIAQQSEGILLLCEGPKLARW